MSSEVRFAVCDEAVDSLSLEDIHSTTHTHHSLYQGC